MPAFDLVPLSDVDLEALVDLMNEPRIGAHLPLLVGRFDLEAARAFVAAKQRMWTEHGFGPRAVLVEGELAGWGGLQPEQGEADFALVLHPRHWGLGRHVFARVRDEAFGPMGLTSITALLPPGRPNARAILRLGFEPDGRVDLGGHAFERFRLRN